MINELEMSGGGAPAEEPIRVMTDYVVVFGQWYARAVIPIFGEGDPVRCEAWGATKLEAMEKLGKKVEAYFAKARILAGI